jgi:hypothetical protein
VVASTPGALVKTCLFKFALIAGGAALASHAFAQPGIAVTKTTLRAPASAPRSPVATTTVAANARVAMPTPVTRTVIAAGSVLVLVEDIVADATIAQIHPPAPGFVYER